jgi:hypothetical protein
MNPLLQLVIEQIVVPEILMIIKSFQQGSGGTPPTTAQIIALLNFDADRGIAIGKAFLASLPPEVPHV